VSEVARRLRVCNATVYKLYARGELAHVRILNAVRVAPAALGAGVRQTDGTDRVLKELISMVFSSERRGLNPQSE
jgi:excisionase family DNA binding protein